MGYTASAHDSTAFKSSGLYQRMNEHFHGEEYILADKACDLERYIITPYKVSLHQDSLRIEGSIYNMPFRE